MRSLADIEKLVREHEDHASPGHPASSALIARAEQYLGISFPEPYRQFLGRWGTLAIGSFEVYGITGEEFENSSVPNAIWYTAELRKETDLPHHLVVLYDDNGDQYFCLDSTDPNGRVVVWDAPLGEVTAIKADSFFDFVVEEALDNA